MSTAQREALIVIRAGIVPTLRPGPGRTVELPEPHDRIWRANHGGKPIQANTIRALERAGHIVRQETRSPGQVANVWHWRPAGETFA